jgi:hypothetical protein
MKSDRKLLSQNLNFERATQSDGLDEIKSLTCAGWGLSSHNGQSVRFLVSQSSSLQVIAIDAAK